MPFISRLTGALLLFLVLIACNNTKKKRSPGDTSMYDVANPFIIKLPEALNEISGIVYYPKDSSVFSIIDEEGMLFKTSLKKPADTKSWRFDKKRDFEDLVLHDSTFYVLVSNGTVEILQFTPDDSISTQLSRFPDADKKENEFEAMYYDDKTDQLVIICKQCDADKKKAVSTWNYNYKTQEYTPSSIAIDIVAINKKLGEEKMRFKPSAAALNPVTNDLYILASVNHLLVVTDREGNVKNVFELDPALYKQAEGITFTPSGDMIISNEWHEEGPATLLFIKNKKKN